MEILDSEKRRARNLIWNAAADYSFEPDFKAYDEDGRADLYWNSIIGAVRKNYGAETIEGLFESLHGCSKEQLFEQLLWLGLENAVYQREAPRRPALPSLRRSYARRVLALSRASENDRLLDVLLTEQGLQESRQKAQATIMSGLVFVNGQRVDKPGTAIPNDAKIEIRGNTLKYVSRGGLKLEKAMAEFPIELNGCICGDIGASTGGFTDCMLQNGASKVYSVDVGYGQLAWKLREDPRVVCMERTNARYLTHEQIPDELDFASIDVSFISLKLILPAVANVLKDGGYVASLVKPQFEAGREKVGKKGVVRDPAVHKEVLEHYLEHAREAGFGVLGLTYSPIRGPEGNIEYLGFLQKGAETTVSFDLDALVEESHQTLKEHGEGTV